MRRAWELLVLSLGTVIAGAFVAPFFSGMMLHSGVWLVARGGAGLQASVRAAALAGAALAPLGIVPYLGVPVAMGWGAWLEIVAIRELHALTTKRAILAMFLSGFALGLLGLMLLLVVLWTWHRPT